jgi:hypothetical protein
MLSGPRIEAGRARLIVEHREVALVFLGEVESQDRVEAVEDGAEFLEVAGLGTLCRELVEDAAEASDEVHDLGVGAAHRPGRILTAEDTGQHRVQLGVFCLFVGKQHVEQKPVHGTHAGDRVVRRVDAESIGGHPDSLELSAQFGVFVAESAAELGVGPFEMDARSTCGDDAEGVEDHGDVDEFLEDGTVRGREEAGCGCEHRSEGQGHADHDALAGDAEGAACGEERVGEAIETIDGQDDVGCL